MMFEVVSRRRFFKAADLEDSRRRDCYYLLRDRRRAAPRGRFPSVARVTKNIILASGIITSETFISGTSDCIPEESLRAKTIIEDESGAHNQVTWCVFL